MTASAGQKSVSLWLNKNHVRGHTKKPLAPNGFLFTIMDDKFHDERRRIVSSLYSMSSILEQEKYIDSCSNLFSQKMGEFAERGEIVDLGEWIQM